MAGRKFLNLLKKVIIIVIDPVSVITLSIKIYPNSISSLLHSFEDLNYSNYEINILQTPYIIQVRETPHARYVKTRITK